MKRQILKRKHGKSSNVIIDYIKKDFNIYLFSLIVFILGTFIGVLLINNLSDNQSENMHNYILGSIQTLKNCEEISHYEILKKSISKNIIIVTIIWILGLTYFGKYFLYILLLFLGINFGYTISSIMNSLQFIQGILFLMTSTLLQNIIFIPSIIFLIVQGIKIHNDVDIHRDIKHLSIKFSAFCIIIIIFLLLSSLVETYISSNILIQIKKYI